MSMSLDALTLSKLRSERRSLFIECSLGTPKDVAETLNLGVDVDIQNLEGDTALGRAVYAERTDIVELLIMRGAKIDLARISPLYSAIMNNDRHSASLLLQHKAQVNVRDYGGQTPLHMAVCLRNAEIARLLLENKADYTLEDNANRTPMMVHSLSTEARQCILDQMEKDKEVEIAIEIEKDKDKDKVGVGEILKPKS